MTGERLAAEPRSSDEHASVVIFFVDVSLGQHQVPEMLRAEGRQVRTIVDLGLQSDTPDTEWIRLVAERGWVALLKDTKIRRKPDEQAAYRATSSALFFFTSGNATGPQQADAYRVALPAIERRVAKFARPMLFTVDRSGKLELLEGEKRAAKKR